MLFLKHRFGFKTHELSGGVVILNLVLQVVVTEMKLREELGCRAKIIILIHQMNHLQRVMVVALMTMDPLRP